MSEVKSNDEVGRVHLAEQNLINVLFGLNPGETYVNLSPQASEALHDELKVHTRDFTDHENELLDEFDGLNGKNRLALDKMAEKRKLQKGSVLKEVRRLHTLIKNTGKESLVKFAPYTEGSIIEDAWGVTCDYDVMHIGLGKSEGNSSIALNPGTVNLGSVFNDNDEVLELIRLAANKPQTHSNPLDMPVYQFAKLIKTSEIKEKYREPIMDKFRYLLPEKEDN